MSDQAHLTSLPLELVQKIASLCSLTDILALSHTCRTLRNTCHDGYVLQEALMRTIKEASIGDGPDMVALRKSFTRIPQGTWSLLAVGASNVPLLIDKLETLLAAYESVPWNPRQPYAELESFHRYTQSIVNIIGVLSTLTVLGHPTINNFAVRAALTGLATRFFDSIFWAPPTHGGIPLDESAGDNFVPYTFPPQVAFCLAVGCLEDRVLNNMPLLCNSLAVYLRNEGDGTIPRAFAASFEGTQKIGLLITVCLRWILYSDPATRIRNDLPHSASIPLLNTVGRADNLPLPDGLCMDPDPDSEETYDSTRHLIEHTISPFALAPSFSSWHRENINNLITDITVGEWTGYYTQSVSEGDVDDPLRNINFTATPDEKDPENTIQLHARGCTYFWGTFDMSGTVHRPSGRVELARDPASTSPWRIHAVMTPLGIAGTWGARGVRGEIGLVWLYKKEWARRPAEEKVKETRRAGTGRIATAMHFSI